MHQLSYILLLLYPLSINRHEPLCYSKTEPGVGQRNPHEKLSVPRNGPRSGGESANIVELVFLHHNTQILSLT